MLDLAFIRNHSDIVREAAWVKYNPIDIDYLLEVERQVLELQHRVEKVLTEQNKISTRIREAGKDWEGRSASGHLSKQGRAIILLILQCAHSIRLESGNSGAQTAILCLLPPQRYSSPTS